MAIDVNMAQAGLCDRFVENWNHMWRRDLSMQVS